MSQNGDYPFTVYVWNRFPVDSAIKITVLYCHWPNELKVGSSGGSANAKSQHTYCIQPGDVIGFPLYWGDTQNGSAITEDGEYLDVSIDKTDPHKIPATTYYIALGEKAIYKSTELHKSMAGRTNIPSGIAAHYANKNNITNSVSGIWTVNPTVSGNDKNTDVNDWKVTVRKYIPDPESTTISIGPDLP